MDVEIIGLVRAQMMALVQQGADLLDGCGNLRLCARGGDDAMPLGLRGLICMQLRQEVCGAA